MQKKKPVKKGSKKKKFLFIDLELLFENNLKLVSLVIIAVFLLSSSFEILSKVADLFLDLLARVLVVLILVMVVLYVVFPLVFALKNKIALFLQFIVFPVILFLVLTLGVKSGTDLQYLVLYSVLILIWFCSYIFVLQRFPVKNFNYRAAYVLIACLLLFVVGMLVAFNSVFYAQTTLGLYLNNCETNERISGAHFICEGLRGDLFVGEQANCMIYGLEQGNLTTELNFTHFNGTRSDYAYSSGDSISFIVPADVARVNVRIQSAEPGNEYCASSADNMTFTTYANFRQQLKELGFYFVAIISFILLYVPTLVGKWMDLFKREGKK